MGEGVPIRGRWEPGRRVCMGSGGRISFGPEDRETEQDEDDYALTPLLAKKTALPVPANRKPTQRASRGVRNVPPSGDGSRRVSDRPSISEIRDLSLEAEGEAFGETHSPVILAGQLLEEQETEAGPEDAAMRKRVEEARRLRVARQSEALLEEYVSLEDTTQMHLDESDLAFIMRSGGGQRRRHHQGSRRPTWEDPDEAEAKAGDETRPEATSESDDQDGRAPADDGLDEEAFEAHRTVSGRITMRVVEDSQLAAVARIIEGGAEGPDDDDDEESRRWELQQINKGFSSGTRGSVSVSREARKAGQILQRRLGGSTSRAGEGQKPLGVASTSSLLSEVTQMEDKLSEAIDEARRSLSLVELRQAEVKGLVQQHTDSIRATETDVGFYASLNGLIFEYADMLDYLMPRVEALEQEWVELLMARKKSSQPPQQTESATESLWSRKQLIFAEVEDDFSSPRRLLERLMEWKRRSPQSYEQCFIALCIPGLLEIFGRMALIGFDPTSEQNWVGEQLLSKLDLPTEAEEEVGRQLLTTILLPKIIVLIRAGYDADNAEHVGNIARLRRELSALLPEGSRLLIAFDAAIGQ